eukprot:snap_masked-scaffold_1-processed-gene-18.28-mRNA-1 protein AED:1.00 eAED:1.00 QI:0/-1/0/0/-1/1/1/0/1239
MAFRRRFSTLKGRMSFTEQDLSPPNQIKQRLQKKSRRHEKSTHSSSSSIQPESLNQNSLKRNKLRTSASGLQESSKSNMKMLKLDPTKMPETEEIDRLFEELLDALAMPKAQGAALKGQAPEKKWKMIVAQRHMLANKSSTKVDKKRTASYWIDKFAERDSLGRPRFTVQDALTAQSVFRTSHRDFLLEFIETRGVKIMNELVDFYTGLEDRTEEEYEILSNLIDSYRLLMNTEIGMEGVLVVPGSITSIAMAMDYLNKHDELTEKVILLLSVACWWSERGRKQVMSAIKVVKLRRRELSRFQTIVFLLEYTTDISFKASIATFITTVCNTPPTIEQRVKVRNDFFTLDIINVFQRVLHRADQAGLSEEDKEHWVNCKTQYEVFVTMMRQDQKEIVHKLIRAADDDAAHFDLSNLGESWKLLQRNANKADCQDNLLNVVQALFMIPTVNELATPIYETITKFIFEATSLEKINGQLDVETSKSKENNADMNFERLGRIFQRKLQYDAKVEAFSGNYDVLKKQQKIIKIMQKRLMDVSQGKVSAKEALDLQKAFVAAGVVSKSATQNIKKAADGAVGAGSPAVGGSSVGVDVQGILSGFGFGGGNEIEIMKQREAKLKKEIDVLQKEVAALKKGGAVPGGGKGGVGAVGGGGGTGGSNDPLTNFKGKLDKTGLVPAGIAPGKTKKDPPPVPKAGMPGSLQNAPIPVEKKSPQPAGDRPMSPLAALFKDEKAGKKGGKAPGGGGGLAAMLMKKQMAAKPKNNAKLEKQRAALKKLGLPEKATLKPKIKMTQLFWNVVSPENLEQTVWPELSDQNVKYNPTELESLFGKKKVVKKKAAPKKETGNEEIKLIDGKRRQNVAIAYRRLKLDAVVLRKALLAIDVNTISYPTLQVLEPIIPTTDELTLLEKFQKEGRDAKKLAAEEKFLMEMSQIPRLANRLKCMKTNFTINQEAQRIYRIIKMSKEAITEVNSSAYFRRILEIILAVGNYLNGGTVRGTAWGFKLDILPKLIDVKDSVNTGTLMHYLYVIFERSYPELLNFSLPKSADVLTVSFKETAKDLNVLAKSVQLIRTELKKKTGLKGDNFKSVFSPFEVRASQDVAKLQKALDSVRGEFQTLCIRFAEESDKAEPNSFFPKLVSFEQGMKRAQGQIEHMRKEKERKRMVEDKRLERQTQKKLQRLVEATGGGDDVEGLIEAFKQSQNGKTSQIVDRFLQKYRREKDRQRRLAEKKSKAQPRARKYLDA